MFRHDVYVHFDPAVMKDPRVDSLLLQLAALAAKVVTMAADVTSVKALISDLNDESNAIAGRLDAQATQIATLIAAGPGAATPADLQAIFDGLTSTSARLKALGADPANPIPPVVAPAV